MKSLKSNQLGPTPPQPEYIIQTLGEVHAGDHICGIFESEEDQISNVTQFLLDGLKAHEKVLYIEDSEDMKDSVLNRMSKDLDWKERIDTKQLIITSSYESYLKDGRFIWENMINLLEQLEKLTIEEGYACLRVTAEPRWILNYTQEDGYTQFVHYECRVNDFFTQHNSMALCQYSMNRWKSAFLLQILTTHPSSLIGKEMFYNFYYIPPVEFLANDLNSSKLKRWLYNLEQRKRTEQTLIQAKEQAVAASKAKSNFLATLSHEIRTPINGVIGMTDILLSMSELNTEAVDCVDSIKSCGTHLITVINDVLDSARFESGKITLENNPLDVHKTVKEAVSICSSSAKRKGLDISLHIDDAVPKSIRGDVTRLRQILVNLIGNSVKFSSRSPITVDVKNLTSANTYAIIEFQVKDLGIGIPENALETIFENFTQADTSTTRLYGGTGLGLYISKSLISLMGGHIEVQSSIGVGSTFRFSIPFTKCSETLMAGQNSAMNFVSSEDSAYAGMRVLVAEDNTINQKVMSRLLTRFKVSVKMVSDGIQAYEALKNETFDVLFMDLHMPNCDGWVATEMIRNDKTCSQPIIVALTAALLTDELISSLWDGYIVKPITLKQIQQTLERSRTKS